MNLLCFDIGGTKIKYGIVDKSYNPKMVMEVDTPGTLAEFYDTVVSIIKKSKNIQGIGFSVPGKINSTSGVIISGGAIPYLNNEPLIEKLKNQNINLEIAIENDANCAAISEMVVNEKINDYICITIGTGIGGGVILNRRLRKGVNNIAGEIGTSKMYLNSGKIVSDTAAILPIRQRYAEKNNLCIERVTGQQALSDSKIEEQFVNELSRLIYNIYVILDLELILIGGAISKDDNFILNLREKVNKEIIDDYQKIDVAACSYNKKAGLVGIGYILNTKREA